MKRTQWSEFDKFVVMADKYNGYLKADYPAYLDYKVVKSVIENIVKGQQPDSYYHDGDYINLGLTKSVIIKMFDKLEKGVWDYDIRTLASRLKLKNLKSR